MSDIKVDTKVTFDAFRQEGDSSASLRVLIPKKDYQIVAEDLDYFYLQRTIHVGIASHQVQEAESEEVEQ
jgi:hypothetical protein